MNNANPRSQIVAQDEGVSPVAIIKRLRKHWLVVLACALLAGSAAFLYSKSLPSIYQAAAMIEISPRAAQPLGSKDGSSMLDMGAGFFYDNREYYETQYRLITSDRVLAAVARNLSLASDATFLGLTPGGHGTVEWATAALRARVQVEPIKYSRLALIKVEDTDPKRAKRLADAVAAAYIDQNLQTALNATSDAVVWLNGQVEHIKQDLDDNENALHTFKQKNDLPSISINEASNMLRLEMQDLNTALTRTRTRHQELSARHAELAKVRSDNPDELPASELLANAFLSEIRKQYQDAVKERAAVIADGKGENHPAYRKANEKLDETRAALLREVRNIQGAVQRDLAIVILQESGEAGLFENARRRAVELNMKEIEYHRLDRTRDQNEKLYAMLLERVKEADLARMMKVNNVRVVDSATEPNGRIRPRITTNVITGVLIGLLIGIALAWVREQLDSSIKTPDEVEQKLGVTFLGLVPANSDDSDGRRPARRRRESTGRRPDATKNPIELTVHDRPLGGVAEAARSIRTNLMFMNPDRPYKKLLVSSAAPSEGKTTVACSIAIAFAQGGQRVCIVDCDLRRPRLHRIFRRAGDAGVTNVLVGDATIDEVAKPTVVDNLWSIPAGPTPPNPADMLHSERFKAFLRELGERFDRVIIDSPPLVAVTDSAIISTYVDGSVFVVRAFKTSKQLSQQGLRALRDVDAPVVGAVLNAVNLNRSEYQYYHYYYYKKEGYAPLDAPERDAETEAGASPPN